MIDKPKGKKKDKKKDMKNIIILKQNKYGADRYHLSDSKIRQKIYVLLTLSIISVLSLGIGAGYLMFNHNNSTDIKNFQTMVAHKENDIQEFKASVNRELDALALQIGGLYAQSLRINALGDRLTEVVNIDDSEFDFSQEPGVGGAGLELTNKENTAQDL